MKLDDWKVIRDMIKNGAVFGLDRKSYLIFNKYHELHSENTPAYFIPSTSTQVWYLNGRIHREDGPAAIYNDGLVIWARNGDYHRTDGPAIIQINGDQEWYQNGKLHRTDGPAIVRSNGKVYWFEFGEPITGKYSVK